MKRRILSLCLVSAFAATSLSAQKESPTPVEESTPTPAATVEPAPTVAPIATPPAAAAAKKPVVRKKREGGRIQFGDGEDSLTINIGAGDSTDLPEPPEPPDAADTHDSAPRHHETPEETRVTILKNVVLPIVAIVLIFGGPVMIVALVLFYRMKKNRLLHQTIASIVASGQPIPPELLQTTGAKALPTPQSDLRKGIILCMVGLGLIGFFLGVDGPWGLGCIPLAWGGGHLLTAKFAPRGTAKTNDPL